MSAADELSGGVERILTSGLTLKPFPAEGTPLHVAHDWANNALMQFGKYGLRECAKTGAEPDICAEIVLHDLSRLPSSPSSGPDLRFEMQRAKLERKNIIYASKRKRLHLNAFTNIYAAIYACVEKSDPALARWLFDHCDMTKYVPPQQGMDGPRAFKYVMTIIDKMLSQRLESDKAYYQSALELQLAVRLPYGCSSVEFSTKAHAFMNFIRPYLARPYTNYDASMYIINLLPDGLKV